MDVAVGGLDEAQRVKRRQQWLERAGRELQLAEAWEADRAPDALADRLDRMVEISGKSDVLTPQDKLDIQDRVRTIKLKLYEGHINVLLEQAMAVTRDKDRQAERGEVLRRINDVFNVAVRLGIREAIKQGIKDRLDIIQQTSAAGDSTKAREMADREAALVESSHPREHRTFTRW